MRLLPFPHYLPTLRGALANAARGQAVFPYYASFKLTSRCPRTCPYCNNPRSLTKDLGTSDILKILDNISRSSVLLTAFEGGEPLLRPDLGELLRYARSCRFYLLLTTSAPAILERPARDHLRWVDFVNVSIDEGHGNLEMFETVLPDLTRVHPHVSVQTVITAENLDFLAAKVERCHRLKVSIVIMPAAAVDGAGDFFPDMGRLEAVVRRLRRRCPGTIHTLPAFFHAYRNRRCSTASIVIGSDGRLFYPCHVRNELGPDLREIDLRAWLQSEAAAKSRSDMASCGRNCGWYQYYAVGGYLNIGSLLAGLRPLLPK